MFYNTYIKPRRTRKKYMNDITDLFHTKKNLVVQRAKSSSTTYYRCSVMNSFVAQKKKKTNLKKYV